MKYILLVYGAEEAWTEEERAACMTESTALCQTLQARGEFLGASPLHPVSTATTVQIRNRKRVVTDGPFAETTEQLGGYFLVDVGNLDEAIAIAERIPAASKGKVEIRPIFDLIDSPEILESRNQTVDLFPRHSTI
ncbi:MAG: YciI family protein [Phycisphaerae bacterium]